MKNQLFGNAPQSCHSLAPWLISFFLVILTVAAYWHVQRFDFIHYDDGTYVYDNPHIQNGITLDAITWAFTTGHASNWHPLTWISHMLDYQMFGPWAGGHHLTSLLFHIINTLLLFFVFRKMTGNVWQSAFVAAVFALHPLHVQSVAWISERKDVLSAFFLILTLWAYVRCLRRPDWPAYVVVLLFYLLALMSKPMVVTLPFVLLLLDYWPLNRFRLDRSENNLCFKIARLLREKIPLFILSAASAGITFYVQQKGGAVQSVFMIPLTERLINVFNSYVNYIIKTLYPLNLSVFYPYPNKIPWEMLIASAVILSTLSWIAIKLIDLKPWFIVGWLWFLGTLVPVIGLIQVGMQSMADRYMYLPMTGLLIIAAWGIPDLLSKWHHKKTILSVSAACAIAILFWGTRTQLSYWADTYTLFNRALVVTENNFLAYTKVGKELALKGDYKTAEKYYLTALRIEPYDDNAMIGLGELAFQNKNYDKTLDYYQKALLLRPFDAEIMCIIGGLLQKIGKPDDAVRYFSDALAIAPSNPAIYNKLGTVFFSKHMFAQAQKKFEAAVKLNPKFDKAYYNLGLVALKQGKINEAMTNYQKAISIDPNYTDALKSLGDLLFSKGDMAAAFKYYSQVLHINPDDATTHFNIGVILYHQKKIEAAEKHFYQALQIDDSYEKAQIALAMTRNILGGKKR